MAGSDFVSAASVVNPEDADKLLQQIVFDCWGDRVQVVRKPEREVMLAQARVWMVVVPGSALETRKDHCLKVPGEDFGFPVYLVESTWEFRHPLNLWERWAQQMVLQRIAAYYGVKYFKDWDGWHKPHPERLGKTFKEHLELGYPEPRSEDAKLWINHQLEWAPDGFQG